MSLSHGMNKASDCTCAEPLGSRSGDACLTTFPTLYSITALKCANSTENIRRRIRIGVYCVPSDSRRSRRWPIPTPAFSITALACRRLSLLVTRLPLQHTCTTAGVTSASHRKGSAVRSINPMRVSSYLHSGGSRCFTFHPVFVTGAGTA